MNENYSDEYMMIEYGQMPAGIKLSKVYDLNKMKEEINKSEVDIQNLLNMCQMWSWA